VLAGLNRAAESARKSIEAEDLRQTEQRIASFQSLSIRLGVSATSLVTSESETLQTFAKLIAERNLGISESEALNLLQIQTGSSAESFQTTITERNQLANNLAYRMRQQLIQSLP